MEGQQGGQQWPEVSHVPRPQEGPVRLRVPDSRRRQPPQRQESHHALGALYDLYAPDEGQKVVKPVGEYNASRVVAQGTRLEHWLNGKKILEVDTASAEWKDRIAKSKFKSFKEFAAEKPGPILLQDHNNEIWFRNIKIRPLPARPAAE